MTRALSELRGMSDPDVKVLQDIQRVGWHVVKVFAQEGEQGPDWAFSIGLFHSFGHPEVLLIGLPRDTCMTLINVIGRQVQAGERYQPGEEYADILQAPYNASFGKWRVITIENTSVMRCGSTKMTRSH